MIETDSGRLLIAGSESADHEALVELLLRAGFRVESVLDCKHAVTALMESDFEVAILDLALLKCDAHTIPRRITNGRGRRPGLIALGAGSRGEDRVRSLNAGFDRYLTKPLNLAQLFDILAELAR